MIELQVLNWVLKHKDFYVLSKNGIDESYFVDYKDAYRFIRDFVKSEGYTPSVETVLSQVEFHYIDVSEDIDYLVRALKDSVAKREIQELLEREITPVWDNLNGVEFARWLHNRIGGLVKRYDTAKRGIDLANNPEERLEMYFRRANRISKKIWHSDLKSLDDLIGGFVSGTFITLIAETGQGKSWISRRILPIPAWIEGANVLDYCLEMTQDQIQSRLDSMLGAMLADKNLNTRFSCKGLMFGTLSPEELSAYKEYLRSFKQYFPHCGKYIIKTLDDISSLTIDRLEADIEEYDADIVVIDPFYYMSFLRNIDHKTGGAAERTSRELRKLFNRMGVIGLVVAQAVVQKKGKDVEVEAATLDQAKTTKALIEDAGLVFSFAAKKEYNLGLLKVLKNRDGDVGEIELIVDFDYGLIKEKDMDEILF